MKKAMSDQMSESFGVSKFKNLQIDKVSKLLDAEGKTYATVEYNYELSMYIEDTVDLNDTLLGSTQLDFMTDMYNLTFGEKNVQWDEANRTFIITPHSTSIAEWSDEKKHWQFMELKDGMDKLFEMIFPEDVVKSLLSKFTK